ncbi:MAG TPA: LPS export ABC transporter permease LptG [Thermoanaerobaculia bacterium]|nr:LPS export ABC transporter permease LptG [Thermoanaerobaculia bacterium]
MKILTRYVLKEMIGPTALGFGFYTFLILMKNLFDFAELIIKRSLPISTVLRLLGWSLPHIIVLTIPMSLLFGILIAVGRLSSDSEIIAMRSSGIATSSIYKPVFYLSFTMFLLTLYLMDSVLPGGNSALQAFRSELATSGFEQKVRPRVFFDEYENLVLYVNDVDTATGEWSGVFLSDAADQGNQKIIVANSGRLSTLGPTKQIWVDLKGTETHIFEPRKPERYDLNNNASQRLLIADVNGDLRSKLSTERSWREYNVRELYQAVNRKTFEDPVQQRAVLVELHKKFAIPFACLAFGIVGLPLGITNRRGGKSSGFSLSIAIILIYYVLLNNGEDLALSGKLHPAVGMWAPNLLITAFGIYLISRANSERGSGGDGRKSAWRRLGSLLPKRKRRAVAPMAVEQQPSLASRLDIPFPNILDRYVMREFLKMLALVIFSTTVLFVIVDYTEIAGDVGKNRIPFHVVAAYYRYYIFQLLSWGLPISILVGTLVTFGVLAKNNEVTALKANGVSLYRTAVPIVAIALLASFFSYVLLDFVLPYSNQKFNELRNQIKGKERRGAFSEQQRQWLFGDGRHLFNFLSYDKTARQLSGVQVFEFATDEFRLTRRIWADKATHDGTGWVFDKGWMRSFSRDGSVSFSPITRPIRLQYKETPADFAVDAKSADQMTFSELRRHIGTLQKSGYASDELTVKLYQKTSWPFICVVMALIALPFAFKIGKRGALYGVGLSLFLAFIYWTLFGIFTKFGEVGNLPAMLAAWSANILFGLAAIYMFLRVET